MNLVIKKGGASALPKEHANVQRLLNDALCREAAQDTTGRYAHLNVRGHLKKYPDCRTLECAGHARYAQGMRVMILCELAAALAYLLFQNVPGIMAGSVLAVVGIIAYLSTNWNMRQTHKSADADPAVAREELQRVRQYVCAALEQVRAHFEATRVDRVQLRDQLELRFGHGSAAVKTLNDLSAVLAQQWAQVTNSISTAYTMSEFWNGYKRIVPEYLLWNRVLAEAIAISKEDGDDSLQQAANKVGELGAHVVRVMNQNEAHVAQTAQKRPPPPQLQRTHATHGRHWSNTSV